MLSKAATVLNFTSNIYSFSYLFDTLFVDHEQKH